MSKTSQRKRDLYDQGYVHGRTGHYFYWKRHPQIAEYRRGFEAGQRDRQTARRIQRPHGAAVAMAAAMLFACVLVAGLRGIA
ncbi:hypothetical protein D9M70_269120 [compost metagenome]